MQQSVNRELLLSSLESVQFGLSQAREIIEQSSCFVFKDGKIMTFNDEVSCSISSSLDNSFQAAVKADPLLNILRKLTEDEIKVEMRGSEFFITGKNKETAVTLEKEILLPVDSVEQPKKWNPLHEDFSEAVGIVQGCASFDQSAFEMTCVHIHPEYLEACDNFQLCRWKLNTGVKKSTLVRSKAIKNIASLGMIEFSETDNWIHFRNDNKLVFSCRRYIEESFPDLDKMLKVGGGTEVALPKGLSEAADKAEIFSAENQDENLIQVELTKGRVKIKGQGLTGWYRERKAVKYDGPSLLFVIAPAMLRSIVKKHNSCIVSEDKLKVNGGSYVYVSCLGKPGESE